MDLNNLKDSQFLVTLQAIIFNKDTGKILIGKRKEEDPHIKELTWTFIGGRAGYKELEESMKDIVKDKTDLDIEIKEIIHAKTYPEERKIISIYFCTTCQSEETENKYFQELKWIRPTEVKDYFTTSLHPKVLQFLEKLEKS